MASRQHEPGNGRNLSGSRGLAGGRNAGRTVPVSRFPAGARYPAGGRNAMGGRFSGEAWTIPQPGTPNYIEPEVRRWPHPVEDGTPSSVSGPEPALHYIRCALSYQNQLLADIKALLEQLAADRAAGTPLDESVQTEAQEKS